MSSQTKCHRHKPPRLSWKEPLSKPRLRSEAPPGLGMWVSDNEGGGDLGMKAHAYLSTPASCCQHGYGCSPGLPAAPMFKLVIRLPSFLSVGNLLTFKKQKLNTV